MEVHIGALSDVGRRRNHNEDSYGISPDNKLIVVCDGMGGHNAGEIASKLAVKTVLQVFPNIRKNQVEPLFQNVGQIDIDAMRIIAAFWLANNRIFELGAKDAKNKGMGTTTAAAYFSQNYFIAAHVGDSRIYRFRNGFLEQITKDHSWLNELLEDGEIDESEVKDFKRKNVITRAMGIDEKVKVDLIAEQVQQNDIYLFCSDGLSGPVSDETIQDILRTSKSPQIAAERLIKQANDNGGPDNITAVVARVDTITTNNKKVEPLYRTIDPPQLQSEELQSLLDSVLAKKATRQPQAKKKRPLVPVFLAVFVLLLAGAGLYMSGLIDTFIKSPSDNAAKNTAPDPNELEQNTSPPPVEEVLIPVFFVTFKNTELVPKANVYVDDINKGKLVDLGEKVMVKPGQHKVELRWGGEILIWNTNVQGKTILNIDEKL